MDNVKSNAKGRKSLPVASKGLHTELYGVSQKSISVISSGNGRHEHLENGRRLENKKKQNNYKWLSVKGHNQ